MPTIGVALAVPEPWAGQLQQYRAGVGDATARMIPTHITLVPPVEVGADDLAAVEEHLAGVAADSVRFRVHLRGTGSFRPVSAVVFVAVVEGISHCERLSGALCQGPLAVQLAYPYHPHVTVAHDLAEDLLDRAFGELADFECDFEVSGFVLYAHDRVSGWQPVREFGLRA